MVHADYRSAGVEVPELQRAIDAATQCLSRCTRGALDVAGDLLSLRQVQDAETLLRELMHCEAELRAAKELMQPDLLAAAIKQADKAMFVTEPHSHLHTHTQALFLCRTLCVSRAHTP